MEILIIKLGALGDVLRTSFIAKGFKQKYESCNITWVTRGIAQSLLENNPNIDKIVTWKEKEQIQNKEFDWVISLDDEQEVCEFATIIQTKRLQGAYVDENKNRKYTDDVEGWFGMGLLRPEEKGGKARADELKKLNRKTFPQIYSEMFNLEDMKREDKRPEMFLKEEEKEFGLSVAKEKGINPSTDIIIGINAGAAIRWPLKMTTEEETANLCKTLAQNPKVKVLILGGRDEIERNKNIKNLCPEENIINVEPTPSIRAFASVMDVCDVIITADSLALHISHALNKKTIAFFCPTSPWEIDMFDLGEKVYKENEFLCSYKKEPEQGTPDPRPTGKDIATVAQKILETIDK